MATATARPMRSMRSIRTGPEAQRNREDDMRRMLALLIAAAVFALHPAQAQDIAGMEDCTKTSGLDKRTGCFHSNIEYLNRFIEKHAADMQQKLRAANAEIGELYRAVATLHANVDGLQTTVANLTAILQHP